MAPPDPRLLDQAGPRGARLRSRPALGAEPDAGLAGVGRRGTSMTDAERIVALLDEAAETHHRVYRITDGVDDDWASWYADWLLRLSELSTLLGSTPVRSELVYM